MLGKDGALDFAGGTVVHINAGVAALVGAFVGGQAHRLWQRGADPAQPDADDGGCLAAVGRLVWL